jgi:hypothetical protein
MATKPKPTKAQLDYAKARARASGIDMNQSAKGLRNASKAIVAVASLVPAGRVAKVAAKSANAVKFAAQRANFSRGTMKVAAVKVGPKSSVKVGKPGSVKVVKPGSADNRAARNSISNRNVEAAASGSRSRALAEARNRETARNRADGTMPKPVKIKSGGDIKSAASSKRKLMSYNQLKDMPNLIKIDSAKGNSLKKTAYRPNRRTSN